MSGMDIGWSKTESSSGSSVEGWLQNVTAPSVTQLPTASNGNTDPWLNKPPQQPAVNYLLEKIYTKIYL